MVGTCLSISMFFLTLQVLHSTLIWLMGHSTYLQKVFCTSMRNDIYLKCHWAYHFPDFLSHSLNVLCLRLNGAQKKHFCEIIFAKVFFCLWSGLLDKKFFYWLLHFFFPGLSSVIKKMVTACNLQLLITYNRNVVLCNEAKINLFVFGSFLMTAHILKKGVWADFWLR